MTQFGKRTLVKMVGGELLARSEGDDLATLTKSYANIARRTGHLEAAFAAWVKVWHKQERRLFKAQGDPAGSWKPLKRGYERWKRINYPGKPVLVRENALIRSLTGRTRHSVIEVRPRTLRLGTKLFYSAILQEGGPHMIARPHVLVMQDAFNELSRLTTEEIMRAPELKGGRRR